MVLDSLCIDLIMYFCNNPSLCSYSENSFPNFIICGYDDLTSGDLCWTLLFNHSVYVTINIACWTLGLPWTKVRQLKEELSFTKQAIQLFHVHPYYSISQMVFRPSLILLHKYYHFASQVFFIFSLFLNETKVNYAKWFHLGREHLWWWGRCQHKGCQHLCAPEINRWVFESSWQRNGNTSDIINQVHPLSECFPQTVPKTDLLAE